MKPIRVSYSLPIAPRAEWLRYLHLCASLAFSLWLMWFSGRPPHWYFVVLLVAVFVAFFWWIFLQRRTERQISVNDLSLKIIGLFGRTELTIRKEQIEKLTKSEDVRWIWFQKRKGGMTHCQRFDREQFSAQSWSTLTAALDGMLDPL